MRVCLTLAELGELLGLPEGLVIEGVATQPPECRPGIAVVISGPNVPACDATGFPMAVRLDWYRAVLCGKIVAPAEAVAQHLPAPEPQPAQYMPAREPVAPADPAAWPRFPGEELPISNIVKPTTHMGGPR